MVDSETLADAYEAVRSLRLQVAHRASELEQHWQPTIARAAFRDSAKNLAFYLALRTHDLRPLQLILTRYGLSSLGRSESRVRATLDALVENLGQLSGRGHTPPHYPTEDEVWRGARAIEATTHDLFGDTRGKRETRILVTLPRESSGDVPFMKELLTAGTDCVRINCAHDDPEIWLGMINAVRRAELELEIQPRHRTRILMDLGGPKVRTVRPPKHAKLHDRNSSFNRAEELSPSPPVADHASLDSARSKRDLAGNTNPNTNPNTGNPNTESTNNQSSDPNTGNPNTESTNNQSGDANAKSTHDLSGHPNTNPDLYSNTAPNPDGKKSKRKRKRKSDKANRSGKRFRVGDILWLTHGDRGALETPEPDGIAIVGCTLPQALDALQVGQRVFIDDGKLGCHVIEKHPRAALIQVFQAPDEGRKIRSDKGLNFPDTQFEISPLTERDRADLDFVAAHADLVGYSFVQRESDIDLLLEELAKRGTEERPGPALVLKIETRRAVENLPGLLVHAAGKRRTAVMIARGDLAVELGFRRMAEMQEEILWLCEAAHIPVIWATQVLETLAKSGLPTRAEVTDAAMASRAECVMLNKGPHVVDAVRMLDDVLSRMQAHQYKKSARLRRLRSWETLVQNDARDIDSDSDSDTDSTLRRPDSDSTLRRPDRNEHGGAPTGNDGLTSHDRRPVR